MKHLKKEKKQNQAIECLPEYMLYASDSDEWTEQQAIAQDIISRMGVLCKEVLNLYYVEEKSMSEIAGLMNYKGEQSAKNRKAICMRELKQLVKEKLRKENWI